MIIANINNDYKITKKEYELELEKLKKNYNKEKTCEELKQKAINNLIDGFILLQLALSSKIEVSEDEILDEEIDYKTNFSNKEEFNLTLADLRLNEDTLRERIKEKLMVKKYIDKFCECEVNIPEDKLKAMYEKNIAQFKSPEKRKAFHILVKDSEKAEAEARRIRNQIHCPDDFMKLASEKSNCPSNVKCGDLGFIQKGKLLEEFDRELFNLKPKEISKPFKTKFGYHIIMVDQIEPGKVAKFDEIKESLCSRLSRIESELKLIKRIKKEKQNIDIKIYKENL